MCMCVGRMTTQLPPRQVTPPITGRDDVGVCWTDDDSIDDSAASETSDSSHHWTDDVECVCVGRMDPVASETSDSSHHWADDVESVCVWNG